MRTQQLHIFEPSLYPAEGMAALAAWGIAPEAAHALGWVYFGAGKHATFTYPTGQGTRRRVLLVAGKTAAGLKNFWDRDTAELPMPPLYPADFAPDHRGVLYLTNGEKSTLANISAGLTNSANTFGEGNKMEEALRLMQARGVRKIMLAPDCDRKGLETAFQWKARAAAYGIEVDLRDLRFYFQRVYGLEPHQYQTIEYRNGVKWTSNGWDTRDLLLLVGGDAELYRAALHRLDPLIQALYEDELKPAVQLLQSEPQATRSKDKAPKVYTEDNFASVKGQADLVAYVGQFVALKKKGRYYEGCCPFHPDKSPSFKVDTQRNTARCYGACGQSWDIFSFIQQREQCSRFEALTIAAAYAGVELHWGMTQDTVDLNAAPAFEPSPAQIAAFNTPPQGFWVGLITAILHAADKSSRQWRHNVIVRLRLAEVLYRAGYQPGQPISISSILAVGQGAGFSRRTLYRILERVCHLRKEYPLGFVEDSACEDGTVCLPDPLALAKLLGVPWFGAVLLPAEALSSNQAYLAYVLLETVRQHGVGETEATAKPLPLSGLAREIAGVKLPKAQPAPTADGKIKPRRVNQPAISPSTLSRLRQYLKERNLLDWIPGEKWLEMEPDDLIAKAEALRHQAAWAGSTAYVKLFYTDDNGEWQPLIHAGGRRKKPSNNIPLRAGAIAYWLRYACDRENGLCTRDPQTGEERLNLTFVLVTRRADRYFVPGQPRPVLAQAA